MEKGFNLVSFNLCIRTFSFLNSQMVSLKRKYCPTSTKTKYRIRLPNCHRPCSSFISFNLSTITLRLWAANRSRVQFSHNPSWSIKEAMTLLSYIRSVTISLLSIYSESGRRLKRLPNSNMAAASISARCWGVWPPRLA